MFNYVGKTPFAAVNLIMPFLMIMDAIGFMFDTGGSAAISFLRTLLFQIVAVLILPLIFKLDGIWLSIVAAESLTLAVTLFFFIKKADYYHYK